MNAARWTSLQTLLLDALGQPDADRDAFVDQHAGDDPDFAAELRSLLRAADAVPAFLDAAPAWRLGTDEAEADLAGRRIGPYRLVRELGRGGQGRVFLAERDDVGTRVALKLLRGGLASPDLLPRFLTERRVLAGLDHPHIARLLDAGTVEGETPGDATPYFVMEAVEGVPVTRYVEEQALSLDGRIRLVLQICDAVDVAHRSLVVHRDLKPTNILVEAREDGAPSVKLLDFGIAKLLDEGDEAEGLTQTGHRLMTPEYAAPEQVLAQPITVATDIYALGVVLYEMLAGVRPYDTAGGLRDVIRAVCDEVPPPPSTRVADDATRRRLRGDLDTIVGKALAKDPADRYASVRALADDLERHRDGRPVQARTQTLRYRASRYVRRHALGVGVAVLVVLALGGAVAREVTLRQQTSAALVEAEASLASATATSDLLRDAFLGEQEQYGQTAVRTDTMRAVELVDRLALRLDGRMHDQPVQKAMLMLDLLHIYNGLGLRGRGLAQIARAEQLVAAGTPEEQFGIIKWHAIQLNMMGRCEEALDRFDAALRLPGDTQDLVDQRFQAGITRAQVLACLDRPEASIEAFRRLHAQGQRASPAEVQRWGYTSMLTNYSFALSRRGRHSEAIAVLRESLSLLRGEYPPGHPYLVNLEARLGVLHAEAGDLAAGERLVRDALAALHRSVGAENFSTVRAQAELARILAHAGKVAEADSLSAAMVTRARPLASRHAARVAGMLEVRARILLDLNRPGEAEAIAREALAIPQPPDQSTLTRYPYANYPTLAEALRAQGRHAEADATLREFADAERNVPLSLRVSTY